MVGCFPILGFALRITFIYSCIGFAFTCLLFSRTKNKMGYRIGASIGMFAFFVSFFSSLLFIEALQKIKFDSFDTMYYVTMFLQIMCTMIYFVCGFLNPDEEQAEKNEEITAYPLDME